LPYAIIEALGVGTPVIASPVAEIPKMLESEQGLAGALIECDAMGCPSAERLAYHLNRLATEPDLRQAWSKNAHLAFQKFSMENCGKRYKFAFDALINAK
jgi:glycosyltransferase involved in cell wall biosynthesis